MATRTSTSLKPRPTGLRSTVAEMAKATRRVGSLLVLMLPALVAAWASSTAPSLAVEQEAEQPNIIYILTDDQEAASMDHMPKLQRLLVDQGATFSSFIASHALCCPSRATMLRGQYEHNHQVLNNIEPDGGWQQFFELGHESSTVGTWLQDSGYTTGYLGKYLNDYAGTRLEPNTHVPPGWNEWHVIAGKGTYFDYELNENGTIVEYSSAESDYSTDVFAAKATGLIRQAHAAGRPLFLYIAPPAPHGPATPAPRHADLFPTEQAPRPPSFNEADVSDKPVAVSSQPRLTAEERAEIDAGYRERLRALQAVDDLIESVVVALAEEGELDNTFIFFTSDNGYHQGEHRLRGKNQIYEESISLPLVVRGPGIGRGTAISQLAGNTDIAPTIADLADVTPPDFVDGRSLVPLFGRSPPETWRTAYLLEKVEKDRVAGVRTMQHVYVEHHTGERELYNLRTDPYQLQNTYSTARPRLIAQLAGLVKELRTCAGISCHEAENRRLSAAMASLPGASMPAAPRRIGYGGWTDAR